MSMSLLQQLRSSGIRLYLEDDRLRFKAPRQLTPAEREAISINRSEIIQILQQSPSWDDPAFSCQSDKDDIEIQEAEDLLELTLYMVSDIQSGGPYARLFPNVARWLAQILPQDQFNQIKTTYLKCRGVVKQPRPHEHGKATPQEIVRTVQPCSQWERLASSGKTDMDVIDLDEALFLFALGKTKEAISQGGIQDLQERYIPHWKATCRQRHGHISRPTLCKWQGKTL
jgi:hypothetical protein